MNRNEYKYPIKTEFTPMANCDLERDLDSILDYAQNRQHLVKKNVKSVTVEFDSGLQYRSTVVTEDFAAVDLNALRELTENTLAGSATLRRKIQDIIDNAKHVA